MSKGFLISLEGSDGVGKSTQAKLLAEKMRLLALEVIGVREPGGTPVCEEIRNILKRNDVTPIAELLLFNAARNQLIQTVFRPEIAMGKVIVCDRFFDSTFAYQHYGNLVPLTMVQQVVETAVDCFAPDLTLLLELDPTETEKRDELKQDGLLRYDHASLDFKERVRLGFQILATTNPARIKRVDAAGTREQVHERVWSLVRSALCSAGILSEVAPPGPQS
jgi:dTMP kinase